MLLLYLELVNRRPTNLAWHRQIFNLLLTQKRAEFIRLFFLYKKSTFKNTRTFVDKNNIFLLNYDTIIHERSLFMTDLLATPFTHRCVVCGSSFESHQRFATFCSTRCQERFVNQGGLLARSSVWESLSFDGGTSVWLLACGVSLFTLFEEPNSFTSSTSLALDASNSFSIATFETNPYQSLSCFNPPSLSWKSKSHQDGFELSTLPTKVWLKEEDSSTSKQLSSPQITSFINDEQHPRIENLEVNPDLNEKQLHLSWTSTDPLEETKLTFQMKNTCGTLIEQVEELSHASGLAQIELVFNQQTSTFPASQTEFTITDLTEGVHQVTLVAIDQAGNRSTPITKSFTVTFPKAEASIQGSKPEASTDSSTIESSVESSKPQNETSKPENNSSSNNESKPPTNPLNQIPNDRKGSLLKSMSSRHSSISENDYTSILLGAYRITPTFVIEAIHAKGFDIVLTGNNIRELVRAETGWDAGWNYYGVTFPNYQGYRRIWSSLQGGSNILVHEIGHAYDYAVGQASQKADFQQIYQAEASKLFPNGGLYANSADEYYAESFRMYLNERSKVQSKAPQTAAYFKTVFGS